MATAATSNIGCLVLHGSSGVKVTQISNTLLDLPNQLTVGSGIVSYIKSGITGAYFQGCTFDTLSGATLHTNNIDATAAGGVTMFDSLATSVTFGQSALQLTLLSGNLSMPNRPFFRASASAQASVTGTGATYTIIFGTVSRNIGSGYSGTDGIFTAPYEGNYMFTYSVRSSGNSTGNNNWQTSLRVDGVPQNTIELDPGNLRATLGGVTGVVGFSNSAMVYLTVGQQVTATLAVSDVATNNVNIISGFFSGIFLG